VTKPVSNFGDIFGTFDNAPKPKKIADPDPLAAHCEVYLRSGGNVNDYQRRMFELLEQYSVMASPEARERAEEIREYYTTGTAQDALMGREPTQFKKDLLRMFQLRNHQYDDAFTGMLYKINFFYDRDIMWENLIQTHQSTNPDNRSPRLTRCRPVKRYTEYRRTQRPECVVLATDQDFLVEVTMGKSETWVADLLNNAVRLDISESLAVRFERSFHGESFHMYRIQAPLKVKRISFDDQNWITLHSTGK
jgi:hypothetical protein